MKPFLYALLSLGMSVATPAYAVDPETAQEMAAYRREMREIHRSGDVEPSAVKPDTAVRRAEQRRLTEESRQGLERLLGNTQECNSVTIGDNGALGCYQEWFAGGCGNDHIKTREIHQYDLNRARSIRVAGPSVNLTVDGTKIVYHFPDAASAQQAGGFFETYQRNFSPPVSSGSAVGNRY